MGTIRQREFFSTRGKTLRWFAPCEGQRRRAAAGQISAKRGLPVPMIQQASSRSQRLEIDLQFLDLVILCHRHHQKRPFAPIKHVREFPLNVKRVGFTSEFKEAVGR